MKLILVVEDDPIVLLDLNEGLRAALSSCEVVGATLPEALARLNREPTLVGVALISGQTPSEYGELLRLIERGLCVIFTNRLTDPAAKVFAASTVVDRPFDAATLITILPDFRP